MIITRTAGHLRVVRQVAHQDQCGRLVAAWGNAAFARPDPWQPVVTAASCHDEGWRTPDEHPQVRADGRPRGFDAMEGEAHAAIHRASAHAAATRGDRVGLLVGMHGAGLMMRHLGLDGPVAAGAGCSSAAQGLLRSHAGVAHAQRTRIGEGAALAGWAWAAYRILQAVDLLSLYLTWTGLVAGESWMLRRVPRVTGDERGVGITVTPVDGLTCAVNPWPFATGRVEAPVEVRMIADRPYPRGEDFGSALQSARPEVLLMAVVAA